MTYIVKDECIKCKFMDCVEVCPVDCFYEGENMLVIHPDECIDCGVCEPECPVDAIYAEYDLPEEMLHFTELNAELSQEWEVIDAQEDPDPDAEEYSTITEKLHLLER